MTERGRTSIDRGATHFAVGPSQWSWTGERLVIDIDEWTVPMPRRLRGRVTIRPKAMFDQHFDLDADGRHRWRPIAPCASVDVTFDRPDLDWRGRAYVDMNAGSEPLETSFTNWHWSREEQGATTRIHYDVTPRSGAVRSLALEYGADGSCGTFEPGPLQKLPRTGWLVSRDAHGSRDHPARVLRTLENAPFYSRSMLGYGVDGAESRAIHETVDLDRFRSRWVQTLLPFKMPRWTR